MLSLGLFVLVTVVASFLISRRYNHAEEHGMLRGWTLNILEGLLGVTFTLMLVTCVLGWRSSDLKQSIDLLSLSLSFSIAWLNAAFTWPWIDMGFCQRKNDVYKLQMPEALLAFLNATGTLLGLASAWLFFEHPPAVMPELAGLLLLLSGIACLAVISILILSWVIDAMKNLPLPLSHWMRNHLSKWKSRRLHML